MKFFRYYFFIVWGALIVSFSGCQKTPYTNETLPKDDESVTLFFIPSPFGINWESPKKLLSSMILNYFSYRPHFMGHVAIQVSCTDLANIKHNFITGMSSETLNVIKPVFFEHAGMGIVFEKHPGRIDDAVKSEQELIYRLKNPGATSGVNYLHVKINQAACTRIIKYYSEYTEHNIKRYYTLYSRPLYGEGAGCSAFGASFLELIGVMNQELQNAWSYTIHIPNNLIGKPISDNKAYIWDLLKAKTWGEPGIDSMELFFWEPDKMYHWVNATLKKT